MFRVFFRNFGFALDTPARQNASKLAFALAYSYLRSIRFKHELMKTKVAAKFAELYGGEGALFAAPGRINLIGEHTDYNA